MEVVRLGSGDMSFGEHLCRVQIVSSVSAESANDVMVQTERE